MMYLGNQSVGINSPQNVTDVQVNGVSVLNDGVANVPLANYNTGAPGVISVINYESGLRIADNGHLGVVTADSSIIKAGTNALRSLVPQRQHESAFYGLAKAAGVDMASSSNSVGTYTDEAKIAIQKMLGIYQAPWELIREDTFVNDLTTASDHIVSVDSNGQPFELTDVLMLFELPTNANTAEKGYYGQIWFFYNNGETCIAPEPGSGTRDANAPTKGAWYMLTYTNGMVMSQATPFTTNTNSTAWRARFIQATNDNADRLMGMFIIPDFAITSINIKSVKGEGHYKLYGRRNWN